MMFTRRRARPFLLSPLLLLVCMATATAQTPDERFMAARDAVLAGKRAQFEKLAAGLDHYPLSAYVDYWRLHLDIANASDAAVLAFLDKNAGTVLADRLRAEWLKQKGEAQDWDTILREAPKLDYVDSEMRCHWLSARAVTNDPQALDELQLLWDTDTGTSAACQPGFEKLLASGRIDNDGVWERIRRLVEAKRPSAARPLLAWLPEKEMLDGRVLDAIVANPQRVIDRLPSNFGVLRRARETALMALARMARSDVDRAESNFETLSGRFSTAERQHLFAQFGWQGALQHNPRAAQWCTSAERGETLPPMLEDQHTWCIRAALRAGNWKLVHDLIDQLPEDVRDRPEWIYWLGRAHAARGKSLEARALYQRIADQPNFYGNLASDELNRPVAVPPQATPPSAEELAQVKADPSIQRAVRLFELDAHLEGVREWNWALRGKDDRFLLAAAEYANQQGIWDRAINTANRTTTQHNYALRYLAPYRDIVEAKARAQGLDPAWVYGLMRQESRFIIAARSSVGAQGLMQVMPATGRWVAKKIGLEGYRNAMLNDMDTNVLIGTSYMKIIMDALDDRPLLASAGYNAGPSRARKWRPERRAIEGAIYAETIPFTETRDYVKKVMSNAVYYATLFDGKPQSLKAWLGMITPASGDEELPP